MLLLVSACTLFQARHILDGMEIQITISSDGPLQLLHVIVLVDEDNFI